MRRGALRRPLPRAALTRGLKEVKGESPKPSSRDQKNMKTNKQNRQTKQQNETGEKTNFEGRTSLSGSRTEPSSCQNVLPSSPKNRRFCAHSPKNTQFPCIFW